MVIIWISVLLIIKAVNSCVYECSARKLFHLSGHGSPNMTEFWMWLFKYHTAFIIMWIYTLYAEKWSMYLRKKQRHTCNRQSSARTWSDLLQVRRLWFLSMWEGEAEKRNSIKTESDAIQRNLKLFNFFFFLTLWCFFSHICECKKTCIELSGNSSRFLCDFFPLSLSLSLKREGSVRRCLDFFNYLFWNSPRCVFVERLLGKQHHSVNMLHFNPRLFLGKC